MRQHMIGNDSCFAEHSTLHIAHHWGQSANHYQITTACLPPFMAKLEAEIFTHFYSLILNYETVD